MPKYEWQTVQDGWEITYDKIPRMKTVTETVYNITYDKVPRYKMATKTVYDVTYDKVPKYRTETYVRGYRTVRQRCGLRPGWRGALGRRRSGLAGG